MIHANQGRISRRHDIEVQDGFLLGFLLRGTQVGAAGRVDGVGGHRAGGAALAAVSRVRRVDAVQVAAILREVTALAGGTAPGQAVCRIGRCSRGENGEGGGVGGDAGHLERIPGVLIVGAAR